MLIDKAEIVVSGGHGGAGKVSFGKSMTSGPDGGNGGDGGDLYVKGSSNLTLLNQFSTEQNFAAHDGEAGGQNRRTGKRGRDLEILLPVGTTITEIATERSEGFVTEGQTYEITSTDDRFLIAKGGIGGKGNWEFRSPRRTTPTFAQSGLPGEKRQLLIELKLIADFGLIGLPNAGKSSLLNELTNAKAKIGNFAFTTLSPNLGNIHGHIIADIPGLIEGAHTGRGLGTAFLKHIEKVSVLLHCVSSESEDIVHDYQLVREELGSYNKELLQKKELVLLTKTDVCSEKEVEEKKKLLQSVNKNIFAVSIHNYENIEELKKKLLTLL